MGEEDCESLLNRVLNPKPGLDGLIELLRDLGEIRGIRRFAANLYDSVDDSRATAEMAAQEIEDQKDNG